MERRIQHGNLFHYLTSQIVRLAMTSGLTETSFKYTSQLNQTSRERDVMLNIQLEQKKSCF